MGDSICFSTFLCIFIPNMKRDKIYPESGVELSSFISKHYDRILAIASMGHYQRAIRQAVNDMAFYLRTISWIWDVAQVPIHN